MHSAAGPGGVAPRRGARGRGGSHPGRAAECIRRPNAVGGRMHSEAVCIRRQYAIKADCNQARMQSISLLPIAYCLLPIAYCLLPICLLPIAYCLLPIAYCLLPIAYCFLPIAYCLLPIAYAWLDTFGGLDAFGGPDAFGRRMHSAAHAMGPGPGPWQDLLICLIYVFIYILRFCGSWPWPNLPHLA